MKVRTLITLSLFVAAIVLAALGAYPLYNEGQAIEVSLPELEQELEERQTLKRRLDELRATLSEIEEEAKRIEEMIPTEQNIPEIVVSLEEIADRNGVVLRDIGFEQARQARSPQFQSGGSTAQQEYRVLRTTLQISGSYEALEGFLRDLEQNLRLVDVVSASFAQSGGDENPNSFNIDIEAQVYYLR